MAEQEVTQTIQSAEAPAQQAPSLTLQDLLVVAQIIQVGSQRGAYRAEELADVGGVYNKIIAFLQASGAITPANQAPADQTAATKE